MATELASGYISLTVKMAKGGMADVTKEIEKAGKQGGEVYADEFNKKVGDKVSKKLPDTVNKSTKTGRGWQDAAKAAAEEFGKGVLTGIEQELKRSGGVEKALDNLGDKVKQTTGKIKDLGGSTGIDVTPITDAGVKIAEALGGIQTAVGKAKDSLGEFKSGDIAGGLQGVAEVVKEFEDLGVPPEIAAGIHDVAKEIGDAQDTFKTFKGNVKGVSDGLTEFANSAPGWGSKVGPFVALLERISPALAAAAALEAPVTQLDQWVEENVPGGAWLNEHDPDALGRAARKKWDQWMAGGTAPESVAGPQRTPTSIIVPAAPPPGQKRNLNDILFPRRAAGGPVTGRGGPKSDIIPIWASSGEHVLTAAEVDKMGGQSGVYKFRSILQGFAGGGAVNPDVAAAMAKMGTPYSQSARNDCSGMVAQIINQALGLSGSGLMSTKTAAAWLAARGFKPGRGGPGTITVGWYDHGPNPNDGHMAMTLSDGSPAEAGGSHGNFLVGAGAKGADSPQFDRHMFLPTLFGEGEAGSSSTGRPSNGSGGSGGSSSNGSGGGGFGADNPFKKITEGLGQLGDLAASGVKETFLPPGFSDPTQWGAFKAIGPLLQFIGGITGDPTTAGIMNTIGGAFSGTPGTGIASGLNGLLDNTVGANSFPASNMMTTDVGSPHSGTGLAPGPAPGQAPAVDNSVHIAEGGQINQDATKVITSANRQSKAQQMPMLGTRRFV